MASRSSLCYPCAMHRLPNFTPENNLLTHSAEHVESLQNPGHLEQGQMAHGIAATLMPEVTWDFRPSSPNRPSLRERFCGSRLGRLTVNGLAALGLAGGVTALEASPALADSGPVYTVINPDNDSTHSIYDRDSPDWEDSDRRAPDFSLYGDKLELICGADGEAVGPYANRRWHYAKNLSRPEAGVTWIPDRYLDTPNKANQPTPGEKECDTDTQKQTPEAKGCYFNLKAPSKNLTFSYEGDHRYYGNAWQAAKNWTDTGAGLTIKPDQDRDSDTAYIQLKDVDVNAGWYAKTEIPETTEWLGPHTTVPSDPNVPDNITILINKQRMDPLSDFKRTYVLTHEMGHTLGLAHPDHFCNDSSESIMSRGSQDAINRTFNTPMPYDKTALRQLYSE
jgi:hypothetical protein